MYFRIGELSEICNVSVKTIRFYEKESLLKPVYVDKFTGYRYYDKTSCTRLLEILMFKELGFSLKEIKKINIEIIKEKIVNLKEKINIIEKSINKLEMITNENENTINKEFVNDEKVIGKWKIKNKCEFPFEEIYFLPCGKGYWVFDNWTKGYLKIDNIYHKYVIENDVLMLYIKDLNGNVGKIVKYENINHIAYTKDDIKNKDNVNYTFEMDEDVIGTYEAIAFVDEIDLDSIYKCNEELYVTKMFFIKDGTLIYETIDGRVINNLHWTKGRVIDDIYDFTSSIYKIVYKDSHKYLFFEWKNGDYTYGKRKPKYYVFLKK